MKQEDLIGEKVHLRRLVWADAPIIYEFMQEYDLVKYLAELPQPYNIEHAYAFIEFANKETEEKKTFHFAIVDRATGNFIGAIGLKDVDLDFKVAETGYWIGKKYWGCGFATDAIMVMINFCMRELKLKKLKAIVFESNVGSIKVLEKCGFKYFGFSEKKYCNTLLDEPLLEFVYESVSREKEVYERF
ncbi:MAG: GNAT family N-acetyltransferase [Ignavibacteria bacterium]|nr:GNAT family N-acetyltransferase [Ignavibacteria bacterium]